ncbi:MAG: translation initiation factor IF-5A [Candidatus Pacearchaeota archaeon]
MAYKLINATEARSGTAIIIDGEPCIVKSIDISKTGKHGSSKVRIEAIGVFDDKKRVIARPGHERFEVPLIEKKKAQVLSISGDNANVMDIEGFETMDMKVPEELKLEIQEGSQVEYWEVDDRKVIKRIL